LMFDLEYYIYRDGYGPTNETLGKFIREIFGQEVGRSKPSAELEKTVLLEATVRLKNRKL